jgi:hypothetical protein
VPGSREAAAPSGRSSCPPSCSEAAHRCCRSSAGQTRACPP